MRVLIIGKSHRYAQLIKNTQTGSLCEIQLCDYHHVYDIGTMASLVFVEADVGDMQGLNAARMILQRFPSTTLVLLMKECQFEQSMQAMRMGASNILVGDEINEASIEQLLQRQMLSVHADSKESITRSFERMLFLHNEGAERMWSVQALNRTFDMLRGEKQYFVLMATSLDFVNNQAKAETIAKKAQSEKIKQKLMQIQGRELEVPFVFYIDQVFYIVAVCRISDLGNTPQEQLCILQQSISAECESLLGKDHILLCSRGRKDFVFFKECLAELDMLTEAMHCSSVPGMLNVYNVHRTRRDVTNMEPFLAMAKRAIIAVEEGGEYATAFRELFSQDVMERLTGNQFTELKEYIAFSLQTICRKYEGRVQNKGLVEENLRKLEMLCTYPYALMWILQVCDEMVLACGSRYHPLVAQCIDIISQCYRTEVSQQKIAEQLNISNVYLSSLFRKETGKKFSAYLNEYRLNKARELIDEGTHPLSQIYEMVGFTNQQYFSNCFRKQFMMTPSEYKNRMRKK